MGKNFVKAGLISMIVALILVLRHFPSLSAEFTMKCGTPGAPTDSIATMARWAVEEVKKRTNGRIDGKVFPASQLGNNVQMIEQLQLGTLECTAGAVAFLSGAYPPVTIFDLPFVFPDNPNLVRKVLKEGKTARWLLDDMTRVGLKGMAFHPTGFKQFTSNKAITKLEDMKGIKFRAMASPILLEQFKALGANAIPIPFAETYSALQSGVAEGQENPYWAIYKMKFHEVQKYLSVSNHGLIVLYTLASKKWWAKLPSDLQKTVTAVFREAERVTWERGQEIDQEAIKAMKAAGLKFVQISPKERERFRKATEYVKNVYIKRIGENGKKLVQMLEADLATLSK
ncbi:MAG: TRAP transporter substrate-binding protein [Candidatus Binatia bacterium]